MRLFLDTSVLLAGCGSTRGSSYALFDLAMVNGWKLITSPWVIGETLRNLPKLPSSATAQWAHFRPRLITVDDVVSLNRAVVFPVSKDRPVLFTALASSQVLLTLDREDFTGLLGAQFYGLPILTPATFLERERREGRLK